MTPAFTYLATILGLLIALMVAGHLGHIAASLRRLAQHADRRERALEAELERLDRAAKP